MAISQLTTLGLLGARTVAFGEADELGTAWGYACIMVDFARDEHIFVVRVWTEPNVRGVGARRGSIQHVVSGERRYFVRIEDALAFVAAFIRSGTDSA